MNNELFFYEKHIMTRIDIDDNIHIIIRDYCNGKTLKTLSEEYGASPKTIMKRIKNALEPEELEIARMEHRKSHIHETINKGKVSSSSGYYRVYVQKANIRQGYVYVYEAPSGKRFSSKDIDKLKEKVLSEGYVWKKY